jgi:hypothetical protein
MKSAGFVPIGPEWPSCYDNLKLLLTLSIYVDDFKLSGPTHSLAKGWELIRQFIKTDNPTPLGKHLGCNHILTTAPKTTNPNP